MGLIIITKTLTLCIVCRCVEDPDDASDCCLLIDSVWAALVIPVYLDAVTILFGAIRKRIRKTLSKAGQEVRHEMKIEVTPVHVQSRSKRAFFCLDVLTVDATPLRVMTGVLSP